MKEKIRVWIVRLIVILIVLSLIAATFVVLLY